MTTTKNTAKSPVASTSGKKLPLEGIRIIDFTVVIAGPAGTAKLADLGAEVIRIESIQEIGAGGRVDRAKITKEQVQAASLQRRSYPDQDPGKRPWNRSAQFNAHSRNKMSMTVDLRKPEGKEILAKLAKVSDVVIENHATDYMEHLGLTYEWFKSHKPDIIMVRMPGYGTTGPNAYWRSFGITAEAHAGRLLLSGYTDESPTEIPWRNPPDPVGGATAAFATLMALHYRNRTGRGQMIDHSLAEVALNFLGPSFMDWTVNGRLQQTVGNGHQYGAPHNVYRVVGEDKWVSITVTSDIEWEGFCNALGNPEWTRDPSFKDPAARYKNQAALDAHVREWTKDKDGYQIMHLLQKHGVPAGPVMDPVDCYRDPHLKERGYFEKVTHPETGTHLWPGMFFQLSETPLNIRRYTPRLGEDNEYVYKALLGYSEAEYKRLEAAGHIGMDYAPHVP